MTACTHTGSPLRNSGRRIFPGPLTVPVAALFLLLLVLPAAATAPSNITIAYNPDMHRLFVTVTHPTENPETHYIRGIQVKINGEVISDPVYTNQSSRTSFTRTYDVMANPGDAVWVVATCIQGQSLEAHIEIPKPGTTSAPAAAEPPVATTFAPATPPLPPATATTYADPGLIPLFGAVAVLLALKR
jgi:hypothetical protein